MIPVTPSELPRAQQALVTCAEGPIFLQSNLHRFGLGGDDRRAVRLWRDPDWRAFIGLTGDHVLLPQMRDAQIADWGSLPGALAGNRIVGINGEAAQVQRLRAALSIADVPTTLDDLQPSFALDLADMTMPDCAGYRIAPLRIEDSRLAISWRAAYRAEISGDTRDSAALAAPSDIEEWLRDGSHYVLWHGEQPVSLAGVNARLPGLVQIGGVFTPAALRGRGLARRAVAMMLQHLRAEGIESAFLFAASDVAARAYTAIGFRPAGQMRMVIHADPVEVAP